MGARARASLVVVPAVVLAVAVLAVTAAVCAWPGRLSGLRGADRVAVVEDGLVTLYEDADARALLAVLRQARAVKAEKAVDGPAVHVIVLPKGRLGPGTPLTYVPGSRVIMAGGRAYQLPKELPRPRMPGGPATFTTGYGSAPRAARLWIDGAMKNETAALGRIERAKVLFISLGEKPTSGYEVRLVGLERTGSTWRLLFEFRKPEPGEAVNQVLTTPIFIAVFNYDPDVEAYELTGQGQRSITLRQEMIPVPQPARPEGVTFEDQRQVEQLIRACFDSLERDDWGAAWELETSSQQAGVPKAEYLKRAMVRQRAGVEPKATGQPRRGSVP
ncbi:MAG: protease complex subunit PrcB family protein [Bacillota bacterium]